MTCWRASEGFKIKKKKKKKKNLVNLNELRMLEKEKKIIIE